METSVSALRQHASYEPAMDLAGFEVRASDGRLGRIGPRDEDADPVAPATGRHALGGEPVVLPVGAIVSIDLTDRVVYLDRTKEEIRRVRSAGRRAGVCYLLREV